MYNAAEFLHEAVASILTQTYRDFELIVVDDASRDDSLSVLERLNDDRVRIVRHLNNMGAAVSRNDALAMARGEYIAILDADDVSAPTRLARQVAFLDANPSVGLVGCAMYDVIDAGGDVLYTAYLPETNDAIQRTLLEEWCFVHSSVMFRKTVQEGVGGYRPEFESAEDHDFLLRMLNRCQAHNLPERLVSYRFNPTGLSVTRHEYINELGAAAMRLAKRRRSGQEENLEAEMLRFVELKRKAAPAHGLAAMVQACRNSLYAANRYYGLGCRELCAERFPTARRCFVRSLRTNALFPKSWIGLTLAFLPFGARRLKFLFRSSMQTAHSGQQVQSTAASQAR